MSKERMEELEAKYSTLTITSERDGIEYTDIDVKDLVFLIQNGFKQAERVQDLENHLKLYEFWYRTAYEQNKRYREALELLVKQETIGNDVKTGKTAISYNGMIALKGLGVFNDDNYIVYGLDEIIESVLEESE